MNQPLAIQSWCYRNFKPLPDFLTQLKAAGVSAAELCAVHADFGNPSSAASVAEQCREAGVRIVAIGVEYLTGDPAKDRSRFEWCKAAGVKYMSISFKPESMFEGLKNIEKLADEFDLTLGIHNHGGYDWLGNNVILKYIFGKTSKRIGLYLDSAWAIDAKMDPIKMVEEFADRVYGVHVKDFIYDRARNPADVIIGTGNLDLPRFMSKLKGIKFSGPLVIEYEGDEKNPVPALSECVKKLTPLL
jgi:inosose dehydratase